MLTFYAMQYYHIISVPNILLRVRKYRPQRLPVTGGGAAKDNKMILLFNFHRFMELEMFK